MRQGEFCLLGLYGPQAPEHPAESALALRAPVAVAEGDEANPRTHPRADRPAQSQSEGRERAHRVAQPGAPGVGQLLPIGDSRPGIRRSGPVRLRTPAALETTARRAEVALPLRRMAPRTLPRAWLLGDNYFSRPTTITFPDLE